MCGIIAIVRRRSERTPPTSAALLALLEPVPDLLDHPGHEHLLDALTEAASQVAQSDRLLRGSPGVQALLPDRSLLAKLENTTAGLATQIEEIERDLDTEAGAALSDLEAVNAALISLKDAVWAVQRDRLRTARAVEAFAGRDCGVAAIEGYL